MLEHSVLVLSPNVQSKFVCAMTSPPPIPKTHGKERQHSELKLSVIESCATPEVTPAASLVLSVGWLILVREESAEPSGSLSTSKELNRVKVQIREGKRQGVHKLSDIRERITREKHIIGKDIQHYYYQ